MEKPNFEETHSASFLQEVDRECTALCSLKNPSCLRSPKKEDLQSFSFKKVTNELESKAPLFSAVLWTVSVHLKITGNNLKRIVALKIVN